jgi:hypothetical protein
MIPLADGTDVFVFTFTNVYSRIVVVGLLSAGAGSFLRVTCHPNKNPFNPKAYERSDFLWIPDFAIGATIAYFSFVASQLFQQSKDADAVLRDFVSIAPTLFLLTFGAVLVTLKAGWERSQESPQLRGWLGLAVPNMIAFITVIVAMFQIR